MFKTFASAVLASVAVAVGNNDGTNRENAVSTKLIDNADVTLSLDLYNADNAGTLEFHGDVKLVIKGAGKPDKAIYGFCMLLASGAAWDCQRIEVDLNITNNKDPLKALAFTLQDQYIGAAVPSAAGMKNDTSFQTNFGYASWISVPDKSKKTCETKSGTDPKTLVACTDVTSHFMRNFKTDDATQDLNMALDDVDKKT